MQGIQGINGLCRARVIFGGYKEVARPDPIPNSAVKRFIADGSTCIACARVGCRQYFYSDRSENSGLIAF